LRSSMIEEFTKIMTCPGGCLRIVMETAECPPRTVCLGGIDRKTTWAAYFLPRGSFGTKG
jgi:hypothetical protein